MGRVTRTSLLASAVLLLWGCPDPGTVLNVIKVAVAKEVTGVSLNASTVAASQGSKYQLRATVIPSYATNQVVHWNSDAPTVATVDPQGLVDVQGIGSARITVTTDDGGFTAACDISTSPIITLSSTSLTFSSTVGGPDPSPQLVSVTNSGGGTLHGLSVSVEYSTGSAWLDVSLNSTAAPANLTVRATKGSLPVSTYDAAITVSSSAAGVAPKQLNVSFRVTPVATYSVVYDGNGSDGGTAPVDSTTYQQGQDVTVSGPGSLSKTGYTFARWDTQADGNGVSRTPNQTFPMGSANVTLYAQWSAIQYNLTIQTGGNGSTTPAAGTYSVNQGAATSIDAGPDPNYAFVNWTAVTNGTSVSFGNSALASTTVTLTNGPATIRANFGPTIHTYAGIPGTSGYNGDNISPPTAASLWAPQAVAFDPAGNLYIAEGGTNVIRKVSTSGTVTTIAGNRSYGWDGDGPATSHSLAYPHGLAVDASGNVYIADMSNYRIRKVSAAGTITTIAGTGTQGYSTGGGTATLAQINWTWDVALDSNGNVYFSDSGNHCIRKISGGAISTVAGIGGTSGYDGDGGLAVNAHLFQPWGIVLDTAGNLYIADNGNQCIRKVNTSGIISTIASGITPTGLALGYGGVLYAADMANVVYKVAGGTVTSVAGTGVAGFSGDLGPAILAQLRQPYDVTTDSFGNLIIADTGNNLIRRVP